MPAILVQDNKINRSVRYMGLEESRNRFKKMVKSIRFCFVLSVIFYLFSPFFCFFFLVLVMVKISEIFSVFFKNEAYIRQYNAILQPQTAQKVVSVIGYRVYDEELDGHLSIIKSGNMKSLADKQKRMELPVNKMRLIGIDKKTATTHILLVGKTGAGKTECIRSISEDILLNGGGIFFNDGKSDTKMLSEFMNQAKKCGRETSVKVINFLKPEKSPETNTFNFFKAHPIKLVEFLGNLAFKQSNEGNTAYFQNRGKALLLPVVSALYIRNKLKNEGLDSERIIDNMQISKLSITFIAFYCMCRDIDDIIAKNEEVQKIINDKSIITPETHFFNNIEKLLAIVVQEPTKRIIIEKHLNIEYSFIKESYNNVYTTINSYTGMIWLRFSTILPALSLVIYAKFKNENRNFFAITNNKDELISIEEIKSTYNEIKEAWTVSRDGNIDNQDIQRKLLNEEIVGKYAKKTLTFKTVNAALVEGFSNPALSIENPPQDAIQQHAYAQQQWSALFNLFTQFKHIVAQSRSEIDPIEIVKDNQILYVLLPPLELQTDQVQTLGKIIIMTIKDFAGYALGGEFIGIHQTIKNIAKDCYTPKPFTLIVLDEYGAYPVGDIDTILAQVRSLNMSVVLGIQDLVSLKTSGSDDTAQRRALANTTKIVFKIADRDTIEWLETMVAEQEVEKQEFKRDAAGELVLDVSTTLNKEKIIPIRKTLEADNGFCLMLLGSETDRAVWCHTLFRGGSEGNVRLIHTNFIKGFKSEHLVKDNKNAYNTYANAS